MVGLSITYYISSMIRKPRRIMRIADMPEILCCQEAEQTVLPLTVAFIKILWLDNKIDKVLKLCIFKLLDELFYSAIKDAILD